MTENTLRDQFAMAALTGQLASGWIQLIKATAPERLGNLPEDMAMNAYVYADAMIKQRQKPKANEGAEK